MSGRPCRRTLLLWLTLLAAPLALAAPSVSVTDDSGRAVELTRPAKRIIALSPHATELVFAAGAGDRLIGVTAFSDYPARASSLPQVGDAARLDRERLLALAPELIIAWPSGNRPQDLAWLERKGITVFHSEPSGLPGIAANLRAIGQLAGSAQAAETAAQSFERELENLRQAFGKGPSVGVFYQVWPQPLFTIGRGHLINRVLAVCGARNLFDDLPQPAPQVSREAVLAAAPDAIVAAVEAGNQDDPFTAWRPWKTLPAVRKQHFIRVPADLLHRPTPRILRGTKLLCEAFARIRQD